MRRTDSVKDEDCFDAHLARHVELLSRVMLVCDTQGQRPPPLPPLPRPHLLEGRTVLVYVTSLSARALYTEPWLEQAQHRHVAVRSVVLPVLQNDREQRQRLAAQHAELANEPGDAARRKGTPREAGNVQLVGIVVRGPAGVGIRVFVVCREKGVDLGNVLWQGYARQSADGAVKQAFGRGANAGVVVTDLRVAGGVNGREAVADACHIARRRDGARGLGWVFAGGGDEVRCIGPGCVAG